MTTQSMNWNALAVVANVRSQLESEYPTLTGNIEYNDGIWLMSFKWSNCDQPFNLIHAISDAELMGIAMREFAVRKLVNMIREA